MAVSDMDKFNHIPTDEILKDIRDTKSEIHLYETQIPFLRGLAQTNGDRMSYLRLSEKEHGVKERKSFIKKLEGILKHRGVDVKPISESGD